MSAQPFDFPHRLKDWEIKMSEMDGKINFLIDRDKRREGGRESK